MVQPTTAIPITSIVPIDNTWVALQASLTQAVQRLGALEGQLGLPYTLVVKEIRLPYKFEFKAVVEYMFNFKPIIALHNVNEVHLLAEFNWAQVLLADKMSSEPADFNDIPPVHHPVLRCNCIDGAGENENCPVHYPAIEVREEAWIAQREPQTTRQATIDLNEIITNVEGTLKILDNILEQLNNFKENYATEIGINKSDS